MVSQHSGSVFLDDSQNMQKKLKEKCVYLYQKDKLLFYQYIIGELNKKGHISVYKENPTQKHTEENT